MIIPSVSEMWAEMKGRSRIERKINAYLTFHLFGNANQPHDKCYKMATEIYFRARQHGPSEREEFILQILLDNLQFLSWGESDLHRTETAQKLTTGLGALLLIDIPREFLQP